MAEPQPSREQGCPALPGAYRIVLRMQHLRQIYMKNADALAQRWPLFAPKKATLLQRTGTAILALSP
jgi:hypothetical protein